ncbi:MAG TPA: copper resistance protein B [Oxalobacteraceae bacterium]|nr:copper resistance protein B [Oxalobacteraceae bacterium]
MPRTLITIVLAFLSATVWAQGSPFPLPPKEWPKPVMDTERFTYLLLDRFEYGWQKGENARVWDVQGWYGGDYNKLWIKSEGESTPGGGTEEADVQALYARRISPFWHLQAGVRQEARPAPSRTQGVLAIQGLAPYWFNVEASVFVGSGRASGRFEAEYDQLLTQRLILQPRIETNFSGSADARRGIGSGLNDVELGLRLRYEFRREFAPYIGVAWTRKLGDTADLARQAGRDVSSSALVAGLRIWY